MKLKNKRSGFTLLEIIIVIIIVGVLASLALPRFFNTIEYSRSTEALNSIGVIKRAADVCFVAAFAANPLATYAACDTFAEIGVDNPGLTPGASFTYTITTPFVSPNLIIIATRVGVPANTITFTYNVLTGATTRVGAGAYSGLK